MTDARPPLERFYELGGLSQAGDEVAIAASAEELERLARWASVDKVESFQAVVRLQKLSATRFSLSADLDVHLVQSCVVTLEPVPAHIRLQLTRELHYAAPARGGRSGPGELALAVTDDEGPEEIESLRYDLAAPLLEELVLAIEPYPRAVGVSFTPPQDGEAGRESPFAVLKKLKKGS